jgi:hypothetical protein
MKLPEHVKTIRELIYTAFVNQFARLGITAETQRDAIGLDAEGQSARAKLDAIIASHIEETGSYQGAYEKALDEYTFTLFNRLAALKVMESHRMFPEVITKRVENGGRSFGHRAWLEQNPANASEELEGLLPYIRDAFDFLGREIRLYSQESTYDMLPYVLDLNAIIAAVNAVEEDKDVGSEIWQSDDIMGWLYESYNLSKKQAFKDSGDKIEFDKVSLTSQVYTPKWVVEFLVNNSLGKLYLEMYPDSEIKRKYKIANVPVTQVRTAKPLNEIRLIDPATGSANFLLYAFDFFYALYQDQIDNYGEDYEEDDIPKLIIENNLYGVDLDDRAIQIAQLGLYIKALRKNSRVHIEKFNVVSSDFYLPDFDTVADSFSDSLAKDPLQKQLIKEIWGDLQGAYQFGSLIRVEERFNVKFASIFEKMKSNQLDLFATGEFLSIEKFKGQFFLDLHNAVSVYSQKSGNSFLQSKTNDAITFLEILTQKYDVAVANPPYTDSGDFGSELKSFIGSNYKKPYAFHSNLYATFIKRCAEIITDTGKIAMIHPLTFMYIKSFEGVREYILNNLHINIFVDYGYCNLFGIIMVDPAFYVLEKGIKTNDKSLFISLDQYTRTPQEKFKKDYALAGLENFIAGKDDKNNIILDQSKLKIIKSWPFIYWISDAFREKFKKGTIKDNGKVTEGLTTAKNEKYIRFWWEVDKDKVSSNYALDKKRWVPYAKGGSYNKYYGNMWTLLDWDNDGYALQNQSGASIRNKQYYFTKGITFSAVGNKGVNYRVLDTLGSFDSSSRSIFISPKFSIEVVTSILNSKTLIYLANCLNPTVSTTVGDIERLPFVYPDKSTATFIASLSHRIITIKSKLYSYCIYETNYVSSPIHFSSSISDLRGKLKSFFSYENHLLTQILLNEAIINEKIFEVYELTPEDKAMVLAKEGESIGGLPVLAEARTAYLAETLATAEFPLDNICEFIETLPTTTLTEQEIADLNQKFETLYQSNNDLEEFCIRNHINPINVCYLFQKSGVLPSQRAKDIAMEFLADLIREILNEDEDGIVPLVRNAGEEILIDRIEKKFEEKGLSSAQFSAFPAILGKEINEYINKNFFADFSDHLNLFMYLPKTPFIWHITSGPRQGFDAYIIIYKWNRDKLFTLKSVYIEKRESALRNRQSDLLNEKTAQAENEKDLIFHQLKEIESLKKKIDELLAEGYDPKLDDGVGKNIAPLQKKGIIAYEVLNVGQLKKYLNADW